jgi:hypothetical protein
VRCEQAAHSGWAQNYVALLCDTYIRTAHACSKIFGAYGSAAGWLNGGHLIVRLRMRAILISTGCDAGCHGISWQRLNDVLLSLYVYVCAVIICALESEGGCLSGTSSCRSQIWVCVMLCAVMCDAASRGFNQSLVSQCFRGWWQVCAFFT